jgi:hypothetical protein
MTRSHVASGEPAATWGPIRFRQNQSRLGIPDSPPASRLGLGNRVPSGKPAGTRSPPLGPAGPVPEREQGEGLSMV